MKLKFTKMHGAGNDFIVVDAIHQQVALSAAQWRQLADRRFGIGADQILIVEKAHSPEAQFRYRIFNADGGEVEHCGNGARAFVKFVTEKKLSAQRRITVETMSGILILSMGEDGMISVDMRAPVFEHAAIGFDGEGLQPRREGEESLWPLALAGGSTAELALVSMGNPHAVQIVADVETAPVAATGPEIEAHRRFARRINAGFMQIVDRHQIRLRVFERGTGETLACGTGACAAVVTGIRRGQLDSPVQVQMRGGTLSIAWGGAGQPVFLSGPATTVFEGEIEL
jgi:diaminopimelate epimerase